MEVAEHLAALVREGDLLAAAADRTPLDTPVPTCPQWTMRDLVRHVGDVHRWAAAHVAEGRIRPIGKDELPSVAGPLPEDAHLVEWFRSGHRRLVEVLESADPDTVCWTFLPAPSPVAFWARRQAHETGIHRADAESPGRAITPFAPPFAVDGIDELLFGFLGRPDGELRADPAVTMRVRATDADAAWVLEIGPEGFEARHGAGDADSEVRGSASDLHLLLWNRRTADGLLASGDRALLDRWRDGVQVQWSRSR